MDASTSLKIRGTRSRRGAGNEEQWAALGEHIGDAIYVPAVKKTRLDLDRPNDDLQPACTTQNGESLGEKTVNSNETPSIEDKQKDNGVTIQTYEQMDVHVEVKSIGKRRLRRRHHFYQTSFCGRFCEHKHHFAMKIKGKVYYYSI